jgi:hypothetical protein
MLIIFHLINKFTTTGNVLFVNIYQSTQPTIRKNLNLREADVCHEIPVLSYLIRFPQLCSPSEDLYMDITAVYIYVTTRSHIRPI